jgi:hypothetical protein
MQSLYLTSNKVKSMTTFLTILGLTYFNFSRAQTNPEKLAIQFDRKYKIGDVYRYKLTMDEFHNGNFDHKNIAICELTVVKDSLGVPYDEVRWIQRKTITQKDTIDLSKSAISVKPFKISLDSKGNIDLPKIDVSDMTEPIQDFITFFVAVSPLVGISNLYKINDSFAIKEPVKADFSNGSSILKGEDCISISVRLKNIDKGTASLYTAFSPPSQQCLSYLISDMNVPVVSDVINNFQMVMQTEPNKYLIQYGREFFNINSEIRKSDGKILSAKMFNQLNLKMKINCDNNYKNCQFEMPFYEERHLQLELLN